MKVCILGVGRSGTTAIYSLLQEIFIDQLEENFDFIYEPFLWDNEQLNGKYEEIIEQFKSMNSISIEGIYNHCHLPLFVENPMKFKGNRYLNKIFNGGLKSTLIKLIRANGRFRLLSEICPDGKFIFIIRNPLDVINSAVIRFSLLGSEFHKDDWNRFAREVNSLYGRGTIEDEKINSQVEKEALYWYYMNKYALESFEKTTSKPLIICYEDYVSRREFWVDKICEFINLERRDTYYDHSKKIAGSQTIKNNISKLEFDLLTGYLDKYTALLTAAGITYPIDIDKITSKYKIIDNKNNRTPIIIGKTPNIMNAHIQRLEEILIKKENELGGSSKKTIELDGTLKNREKDIADAKKRINEMEGKLGKREDEILGSRKRISEMEGTLLTRETEIADAKKRINELEGNLRKREDEILGSRKRLSQLEGTLLTRETEIADVKKRISELEGKFGKRKDDVIVSRKKLSELEGELAAKNDEIIGLKKKKSELEVELVKGENVITNLTNEISIKKELLIQNESSLNELIHKFVKAEASNQNLENQVKEMDRLIRQKDDIIEKKGLENEKLEKRLSKIYHSSWWKVGKFLKKVFNFCFGWMTGFKKDSQGGTRTASPSLQGINDTHKDIKFGLSELKFYENSVFSIKGWCFAEKKIDTVRFFIKKQCIGQTPVNIQRSDVLEKNNGCSDEFCGFMFERVLNLEKDSKLVLNFYSKDVLVGTAYRRLELESIRQKGRKVLECHPVDSSVKSKRPPVIQKTGFLKGIRENLKDFPNENNNNRLYALKDIHKGKRAFLIGNGPSLRMEDLEKLKNEITFASNRIYLAFDKVDWRPTYYTVADHIVAQNNTNAINSLKLKKIFASSVWKHFKQQKDVIFVNPPTREGEKSWDLVNGVRAGYSVINFDLKLAFWMGIREVYVIGVDFYFEDQSIRTGRFEKGNQVIISTGEQNHFHPEYRKAGETWTIPRLDKQREEFLKARQMYEASGGKIYNASRRTKLDAWERVDFDQAVSSPPLPTESRVETPAVEGNKEKPKQIGRSPYLKEIRKMMENFSPCQLKAILEWGAGQSTAIFYDAAVKNQSEIFVTIDNHDQYLLSVLENFKEADFFHPHLVPLSEIEQYHYAGNNGNVCFYSSCPLHYRRSFDLIFVDGRARNECLLMAALLASPQATIIVHDFERVRMTPAKFLFDEINSGFKEILLLKRKKALEPFFAGFLPNEVIALKETPVIASYDGYGATRDDDLSETDKTDLRQILRKYLHSGSRRIAEWGTPASTRLILAQLEQSPPQHYLTLVSSIKHHDAIAKPGEKYPFFDARAVSLIGKREIGSQDPNFHYSSCPIYFKKKFDFFYVGSERRNECLLTAALLLEPDGIVILRNGDLLHYAPGKYFFDTIERIGGFRVMKRKPLLDEVFGGFLDKLPENARAADIDPP